RGLLSLQTTGDQCRVAIDVRADLQHRRAPIAPGQGGQVRLGHDRRNRHRAPGELLEPQQQACLFGKWRGGVMVQDQLMHGRLRQFLLEESAAYSPLRGQPSGLLSRYSTDIGRSPGAPWPASSAA